MYRLFLIAAAIAPLCAGQPPRESIHFIQNHGSWQARGPGFLAQFNSSGFVIVPDSGAAAQSISFQGTSAEVSMEPLDLQPGKVNLLLGNTPSAWQRNLPTYARLRVHDLYPGIDLLFYGVSDKLEYDFAVAPGADPNQIRMRIAGGAPIEIGESGDLRVESVVHRPLLYQNSKSGKTFIPGKFIARTERVVGFEPGDYDRSRELIIDPELTLLYSTYLGGRNKDQASAIKVDASGNSYILGYSDSVDYPVSGNAFQPAIALVHGQNVVISKISPNGTLLYSTYIGGTGVDAPSGLAVDSQGVAYFAGVTTSTNYPLTASAYQTHVTSNSNNLAYFITRLSPDGSSLEYSSLYGSTSSTSGFNFASVSVALDSLGRLYISGTAEPGLPTTAGAYLPSISIVKINGSNTAYAPFVAVFDTSRSGASSLVAATYAGRATNVTARGTTYSMVLDANNNPWLTGTTPDFSMPVTANALQPSVQGQTVISDGSVPFLLQLSSDLTTLRYSTFWVGTVAFTGFSVTPTSAGASLALDPSGDIFLLGFLTSNDTHFPTTAGVIQPSYISGSAETTGFLTKFSSDGTRVVWSTYLNRPYQPLGFPAAQGELAIDAQGNAWIGASTLQPIATTANAYQTTLPTLDGVTANAYIREISSDGTQLLYSSYFGGQDSGSSNGLAINSVIASIALDHQQNLHIAGYTQSTTFPLSATPFQSLYGNAAPGANGFDSFFTILARNAVITSIGPSVAGNNGDTTITITGAGFVANSSCSLIQGKTTIAATAVIVAADGTSVECVFSLNGATASAYDLAITAPGASPITQTAAVTVQNGGAPNVWANIVGRSVVRTGAPSTFYVNFGNNGTTDAFYVQWAITLSPGVTFSFPGNGPLQIYQPGTNADLNTNYYVEADGTTVIPFIALRIPAGQSLSVPIEITSAADQSFTVSAGIRAVWFDSYAAATNGFAAVWANPPGAATPCVSDPSKPYLLNCLADDVYTIASEAATGQVPGPGVNGPLNPTPADIARYVPLTIQALAGQLPVPSGASGHAVIAPRIPVHTDSIPPPPPPLSSIELWIQVGEREEAADIYNGNQQVPPIGCTLLYHTDDCSQCFGAVEVCTYTWFYGPKLSCPTSQTVEQRGCFSLEPPTPPGGRKPVTSGGSLDPNYKSGPAGYGAAQYTAGTTPLTYNVGFENEPTASLPAANVYVTDQLNLASFDLTSLTLQSIVIGSHVIAIPRNAGSYTTTYSINSSLSVRIQGGLNPDTGLLKFAFVSIDPSTNLPPTDPTVGFLPPDTDGVSGQGSVIFSVKPLATLSTGTVVNNQASVVFDTNAPIVTGTWSNTLDFDAPVSQVTALPQLQTSPGFLVSWSGTDVGSGVASYNVYVSDNGAPFAIWQSGTSNTSATYSGQAGHTYGFFSIATDGAGNIQAGKTVADTTTTVANPPALTITKAHADNFMPGQQNAQYTVTVSNGSTAGPETGTVTVTETVPQGMTLLSMQGTGWSCPNSGTTCSRNDGLAPGMSYLPIIVTVSVAGNATGTLTNNVSVSDGGSSTANASDTTAISSYSACDVGHFGNTTVADVQSMLNTALGSGQTGSDLNGDGAINVVDIQIVIKAALGGVCTGLF